MEDVIKIEIVNKGFPIYHSQYLDWTIRLAQMKKKDKEKIYQLYKTLLSLVGEDCIAEHLHFFINDKPFLYENIQNFDIDAMIENLVKLDKMSFEQGKISIHLNQMVKESKKEVLDTSKKPLNLSYLKRVKEMAEKTDYPCFYYYQVPVQKEELFEISKDSNGYRYLKIKKVYLPYLRYLDLSKINFQNVDLRGIDLSYTNISDIDFSSLYQNSLENTNFEGVVLIGNTLANINAQKSNLCGTFLSIDITTTNIDKAKLDDSVTILSNNHVFRKTIKSRNNINCRLHF